MIFVDIDGVLAEFSGAFSKLVAEKYDTPLIRTREVQDWWWSNVYGKEHFDYGWRRVEKELNWWESLESLATAEQLRRVARAHRDLPIIFVTSRASGGVNSDSTYHQTIRWLERRGIEEPLLIHTKGDGKGGKTNKADLVDRFGAYFAIEDSPQNALDYAEKGIEVALLDWPYTATTLHPKITRCGLTEALTLAGVP